MEKATKLFLIFIACTFCGCNCIRSSVHFTQGTRCLEGGDFKEARFHLEKACELEPRLSCYHNNLAYVYIQL